MGHNSNYKSALRSWISKKATYLRRASFQALLTDCHRCGVGVLQKMKSCSFGYAVGFASDNTSNVGAVAGIIGIDPLGYGKPTVFITALLLLDHSNCRVWTLGGSRYSSHLNPVALCVKLQKHWVYVIRVTKRGKAKYTFLKHSG